ncbi:MAG: hypothetical protein AAF307_00035 [Pseudomonadota bacterium]
MDPHPDYTGVVLPRETPMGDLQLTRLSPEFVDEDFDAVMCAAPLMKGIFGDWPAGLTREDNLVDLAWHEREFTARRSFAWIVRDKEETYLGCFYIYPEIGARGTGKAVLWLIDMPERDAVAASLKMALIDWLAGLLPETLKLTWVTRPEL